jgi:hypothetical protein
MLKYKRREADNSGSPTVLASYTPLLLRYNKEPPLYSSLL